MKNGQYEEDDENRSNEEQEREKEEGELAEGEVGSDEEKERDKQSSADEDASSDRSQDISVKERKDGKVKKKKKKHKKERKRRRSASSESDGTRSRDRKNDSARRSKSPPAKESWKTERRIPVRNLQMRPLKDKLIKIPWQIRMEQPECDKRKDAIKEEREQAEKEPEPEVKKEPTARDLELARLLKEEEERQGEPDLDFDPVWSLKRAQIEKPSRQCPYLDTIDRGALDFDFEKLCSVSLSHVNVYACMVCGKYFQVSIYPYEERFYPLYVWLQEKQLRTIDDSFQPTDLSLR
uniref:U4/U6.U5 tri-snRNP-associated protein 1 n=1 Tax=Ascaris lumbricoides TaxID=6252 RepID=A0A0M3IUF2_ASCLU